MHILTTSATGSREPVFKSRAAGRCLLLLLASVMSVLLVPTLQDVAVARPAAAATARPQPGLYYSATPDRADARPLAGATLRGRVYVFAISLGALDRGTFYLDGVRQRVEDNPPYDFRGSTPSGAPRPWDTSGRAGVHTIAFKGPLAAGGRSRTSASFRVRGRQAAVPPPTPDRGRPGPHNTGVPPGTVLRSRDSLTVTRAGAVLDRLDISGRVVIKAPDVVIRRSKIHGDSTFGIQVVSGNVTIEDSEIFGFEHGIVFSNWTARRVDIHSMTVDGVKLGKNTRLVDSYIHNFTPAPGAHADGAQLQDASARRVVVRRNTIDLASPGVNSGYGGNSAIILKPDLGTLSAAGGVLVEGNYLNGGNYTLYLVNSEDRKINQVTIRDNRFGRVHRYGARSVNTPCIWTGNVWDDTGRRLSGGRSCTDPSRRAGDRDDGLRQAQQTLLEHAGVREVGP